MSVLNLHPKKVDLLGIRAGDRNAIRVTVTSGGTAVPLDGYTISAQARAYPTSEDVLSAVIEDLDTEASAFTMRWAGEDVRDFMGAADLFEGKWDLQMASGELDPITLATGRFQAVSDVAR